MMRRILLAIWIAAGCSGDLASPGGDYGDAGNGGSPCGTSITSDPLNPIADPIVPVRAAVNVVGAPGVFSYTWSVTFNGANVPYTMEASDNSQIGFIAAEPGPYHVTVSIDGPALNCRYANTSINVGAPGANVDVYRLRVLPPPGLAPPQEKLVQVVGGADYERSISLDPGVSATGTVRDGASGPGVAAYLKFMPQAAPHAFTEVFTGATGSFGVPLLPIAHDVLVIPTSSLLAPTLAAWSPLQSPSTLVVGPGTLVSGIVRDPTGVGFSGAKVQLYAGGVPSTLATTAPDGSFSLRTDFPAGATITVNVTPPMASGLPRLEASAQFDLSMSMQVTYAASLATCNLQNTEVRRGGTAQGGAKVTVVGALAAVAGSVKTGSVTANALGTVRTFASADASGRLPSMLVPRAPLSAVVELDAADFAVDAIDTSTCAVSTIDAAPLVVRDGTVENQSGTPLAGVRVEATPLGALAQAGAQSLAVTTDTDGAFSLALAAGGHYDVRFSDPLARAARLELTGLAPQNVPAMAALPPALTISGEVSLEGSANPVTNASVQMLCAVCTGIDAQRPVAEGATNGLSRYRVAVPDPGTM